MVGSLSPDARIWLVSVVCTSSGIARDESLRPRLAHRPAKTLLPAE